MRLREIVPGPAALGELIALSERWEAEDNCRGYRKNSPEDLEGRRVFVCETDGGIAGYLFGRTERAEKTNSVTERGAPFFELEELYVVPELRGRGIGRALFGFAENAVKNEADFIMLSTASKDAKRILRFYLDELGMEFWSARLFKKIR